MKTTTRLRARFGAIALAAAFAVALPVVAAPAPAEAATVSCTATATKTVRQGDTGSCVRLLQQRLGGLVVDGSFGPATRKAVDTFQRANGLVVDGIVGPATWSKIKAGLPRQGTAIYSINSITVYACRNSANTAVKYSVRNLTGIYLRDVTLWRSAGTSGTSIGPIAHGGTVSQNYYQTTGATESFKSLRATRSNGTTSTLTTTYGFQRGTLPVCR